MCVLLVKGVKHLADVCNSAGNLREQPAALRGILFVAVHPQRCVALLKGAFKTLTNDWCPAGRAGVVQMSHVDVAVQEMVRSCHMQLLGNCCRLEKVLLAGLVIETRATGQLIPPALMRCSPAEHGSLGSSPVRVRQAAAARSNRRSNKRCHSTHQWED